MLRKIVLTVIVLLLWSVAPAAAHIEKGYMPDSVAEMEYRILLEFEPDNLAIRNQLGMVLYRRGKLDEAAQEFYLVLEKDPDDYNAMDALGLVSMQRKNYQQAIDLFRKAITINPDDMLTYYHLGQTLELQQDPEGAAEAYRTGLARESSVPGSQSNAEQRQVLLDGLKNLQQKALIKEDNK